MSENDYDGYDDESVDFNKEFQCGQRKLYADESIYTCPDCGREHALTSEQKRRGYHCDRCTRAAEQGW